VTLTALLFSAMAALLLMRPPTSRRLRGVLPRRDAHKGKRRPLVEMVTPMCLLGGVSVAVILGNAVGPQLGVVLGGSLAVGGPPALRRLDARGRREPIQDVGLPLALDLLAACIAGGATTVDAVAAVAGATPGSLGERLSQVSSALAVGLPFGEAFRAMGEDGPAGAAARTLRRAMEGGTPVAAAVAQVADEARHEAAIAAQVKGKRVAVTTIAPLLVCFLPAFFLLGVIPSLISAFAGVVGVLS
jgi:pilus assembly protein TadC